MCYMRSNLEAIVLWISRPDDCLKSHLVLRFYDVLKLACGFI